MAIREASPLGDQATPLADGDRHRPWACRETGPPEPQKTRLVDHVRQAIGSRHHSRRTVFEPVHRDIPKGVVR